MKTLLKLTIAFTVLLFACNAWAQGQPQCPLDPNVLWPLPMLPDSPGACFFSNTGMPSIFFVVDESKLLAVLSLETGANDFFRFNPKGKGFWHEQDKDGTSAFLCTDWPNCGTDQYGNPNDNSWFMGTVTLTINGATPDNIYGVATCPYTLKMKGQLADGFGFGNQIRMHALATSVKDPNLGCRMSLSKIDIDPID
jgi:hypothetical protein